MQESMKLFKISVLTKISKFYVLWDDDQIFYENQNNFI